ncbi:MAG: MFS transporter [Deltaproteobacteria bacterium]|nr:MFS transporter [Deltaproteobacteria bacterium]
MASPLRLPARVRHGYGLGALGFSVANTAIMFFILKYLVDGAGLSPAVAGTVLLVAKVWDATIDPFIGRMLDLKPAYRSWLGRATLPFAVVFAAIWWGLPIQGPFAPLVYCALLMGYASAYSAGVVPYGAMTAALTPDYDERTRLNSARMGWSMVGGIVAGVAMPLVMHAASWRAAGALLGALSIVPLAIAVRATRGRLQPRPARIGTGAPWEVLGSRPFRRTVVLFACAWTTTSALSALVPFYAHHVLGHMEYLDRVYAVIQVSALVSVPLVARLALRAQKHVAYAIGMASFSAALVALALLPAGNVPAVFVVCALVGPGVAAAHVLPWSMLPDAVEVDRVEAGRDRTGSFYGAMTFVEQAATALALWMLGMALEAGGYVEGAAVQGPSAILTIRALVGPVSAVILGAAAVFALLRPPLTRADHARYVETLRRQVEAA